MISYLYISQNRLWDIEECIQMLLRLTQSRQVELRSMGSSYLPSQGYTLYRELAILLAPSTFGSIIPWHREHSQGHVMDAYLLT